MVILWWHESKSVVTVQRNFRREFRGGNYKANAPNKDTIQKWYSNFNDFGEFDMPKGGYRGATVVNEVHFLHHNFYSLITGFEIKSPKRAKE